MTRKTRPIYHPGSRLLPLLADFGRPAPVSNLVACCVQFDIPLRAVSRSDREKAHAIMRGLGEHVVIRHNPSIYFVV